MCAASETIQLFVLCVCRAHWLLAMQLEWEASQLQRRRADAQLIQLGKARAYRCKLEAVHDIACKATVNRNTKEWEAVPMEC